ncbi:acyltransferase family protein [Denitromonas sp.]|uniref:acyltransferase family protein n=1 Tax=Denitromonas sp. TaxID=2734609 RepID=UPI002C63DC9F|nr:acyltransferase [Denitromonas sp.]
MNALLQKPGLLMDEGRADLLLIVRGIAALSVVLWHAGGYLGPYPAWMNIPGRTAVWLFFGISGYVIAYGFVHGRYKVNASDLVDFYVNRSLRIYPIFLTLTLLGWTTETIRAGSSPLSLGDIPSQFLAIQFDQDYMLNGVFWTLGIELHFYLLAPLLAIPLLSERRARYLWIPVCLYSASIIWSIYAFKKLGWSFDGRNIVACLPHFLAGMIACRMTAHTRSNNSRFRWAFASAIALIVTTNLLYHLYPKYFWSPIGVVLTDVAIVSLVIAHASWAGGKSTAVAVLTMLGTLSYGLYAWHGYWMKTLPDLVNHVVVLAGLSLFSAYVTYRCVEIPALRLKRVHIARY